MNKESQVDSKIYIRANEPSDWQKLLADPIKHWKTGYSARTLAYCWQEAGGFPKSVRQAFQSSQIALFDNIELLLALPEYKVALPGGLRASQNDIFVLAKAKDELVAIAVEGKVAEDFGPLVKEWLNTVDPKTRKPQRLSFLVKKICIEGKEITDIRYQLIHRTASSLILAEEFKAKNALVLIHSFSQEYAHFDDFEKFLLLYNIKAIKNSVSGPVNVGGIGLYFSWVCGEKEFLSR